MADPSKRASMPHIQRCWPAGRDSLTSFVQVAPPSVVFRMYRSSVAIQPRFASTKTIWLVDGPLIGIDTRDQVVPPFVVRQRLLRVGPVFGSPTAQPFWASRK